MASFQVVKREGQTHKSQEGPESCLESCLGQGYTGTKSLGLRQKEGWEQESFKERSGQLQHM